MINVLYEQMIASIAIYLYFAKMIQQITAGKHQNIHDPLLFQNKQQPIHGKAKYLIPIDSPIYRSFQYALV